MPESENEPRRGSYYEPLRGTVYGVRFGTPGNLPGPLPQRKERNWLLIGSLSAGFVVVIVLAIVAFVLA